MHFLSRGIIYEGCFEKTESLELVGLICILMSNFLPKSVRNLIEEFGKLPGIGPKSAQRLAIYLLHSPTSRIAPLGEAVLGLKENVIFCDGCWNIAESNPCRICDDPGRDHSIICVVEEILDVVALEKTGEFKGLYHVLHGALSPIDGIGPEQLKVGELFERIKKCQVADEYAAADAGGAKECGLVKIKEVILATNSSLEGEATALYIQRHLMELDVKITRIAQGLPVGADLEYADEITLGKALQGRGEF